MTNTNDVAVRLIHNDGVQTYIGLGRASDRRTATEVALKDLRGRIPPGHKRPLICIRREGVDQSRPWTLWARA